MYTSAQVQPRIQEELPAAAAFLCCCATLPGLGASSCASTSAAAGAAAILSEINYRQPCLLRSLSTRPPSPKLHHSHPRTIQFTDYINPLRAYLQKYREAEAAQSKHKE